MKLMQVGHGHDCGAGGESGPLRDYIHPPITMAQATTIFESDLQSPTHGIPCVANLPNSDGLNATQFSALVSFTSNAGCGNEKRGTGTKGYFAKDMRAKNLDAICKALSTSAITANGKPNQGLKNRRKEEAKLCSTPTDDMSGCPAKKKP